MFQAPQSGLVTSDFLDVPATASWPAQGLDVVLPSVDLGRGSPCMLVQTPGQALGLIQACTWEAISPAWAGANVGQQQPVLIWNTTGTLQAVPESDGGFPGTPPWNISGEDKYYAADVDGDGVEEIIATRSFCLGLFKWSNGALRVWWSAEYAPGADGASAWWPQQGDGYLPVRFGLGAATGQASLLAWRPDALAVLAWQDNALQAVWSTDSALVPGSSTSPGGWIIESNDAWWAMDVAGTQTDAVLLVRPAGAMGLVQWDATAGAPSLTWGVDMGLVDTEGQNAWPLQWGDQYVPAALQPATSSAQSLVLYNGAGLALAVAQFNNDPDNPQLLVVWSTQQTIPYPGNPDLPLDGGDALMVAQLQPNLPTVLLARAGSIAAVSWNGSGLTVPWAQQGASIAGLGGTGSWTTDGDCYLPVAGPAPGQQQLLAYKSAAYDGTDGWALIAFDASGQAGCAWQAGGSIPGFPQFPGWNLALVASAPPVPYPSYAAGSPAALIYAQLGKNLAAGDLRSAYTGTNDAGKVQGWLTKLQAMDGPPTMTPQPPPDEWQAIEAAWPAVQAELVLELQNLVSVYQLYANVLAAATAVGTQMDADVVHVIGNVAPPTSGSARITFSWPNLLSSLPASCTTLAGSDAAQASALSLVVSVLPGGLLPNRSLQYTTTYDAVQGDISAAFTQTSQLNALGQNRIAGDLAKAGVVAAMSPQAWVWPQPAQSGDSVATEVAAATQTGNRIQLYAIITPAAYTIYYQQTSYGHLRGARWLKTPDNCLWTTTENGEPYVYTIATGDNIRMGFPSYAMMDEIWDSVAREDFFLGNGPWSNIPHVEW